MPKQKSASPRSSGGTMAPAKGKLGIMIPGMGAVATTFVAGVEAVRKGLAKPIGSVTQMGTIRLGKRTEGRSPLIKDFVPLAGLNDLVFTGWDPIPDDMFSAATKAGVLDRYLLEQLKPFLSKIKPRPEPTSRRARPRWTWPSRFAMTSATSKRPAALTGSS
jgi:myo-inositol-1-phosphate synthase